MVAARNKIMKEIQSRIDMKAKITIAHKEQENTEKPKAKKVEEDKEESSEGDKVEKKKKDKKEKK